MRPDYAAVAVMSVITGKWELLSCGGRVVVFDTAEMAWHWLPTLGQGRIGIEDRSRMSLCFAEISRELPNRSYVVSPYHPEESQPWGRHIIWTDLGREESSSHGEPGLIHL